MHCCLILFTFSNCLMFRYQNKMRFGRLSTYDTEVDEGFRTFIKT